MGRQKGDFSKTTFEGKRKWFSDWVDELAAIIDEHGSLPEFVTHFMLIDAFNKNMKPDHFYNTQKRNVMRGMS